MENSRNLPQYSVNDLSQAIQLSSIIENVFCDESLNIFNTLHTPSVTFKNVIIKELIITKSNCDSIIIENSDFLKIIIDIDENKYLKLINLKKINAKELIIKQGELEKLELKNNNIESITFENGKFKYIDFSGSEGYILSENHNSRNFQIENGNYKNFNISNLKASTFSINGGEFENFTFSKLMNIDYYQNKYTKFNSIIKGGKFKNISFFDFYCHNEFEISGGNFINGIQFRGNIIFEKSFIISGGTFEKSLSMSESNTKDNYIKPKGKFFNKFAISSDCKGIILDGANKTTVIFINYLTFSTLPSYTSINNVSIVYLTFDSNDTSSSTVFSISKCKINSIHYSNFNNHGKMTLNSISPLQKHDFHLNNNTFPEISGFTKNIVENIDSKIQFDNSNLGNLEIIACDLRLYKLYINSSKLINIFYTNTQFPDPKNIKPQEYCLTESPKNNIEKLKETCDSIQKGNPLDKIKNYKLLINLLYKTNKVVKIIFPYSEFPNPIHFKCLQKYINTQNTYQPQPNQYSIRMKDVFEQLQTVSIKQGDINQAIIWQAESQNYQIEILRLEKNKLPFWFYENWWILALNKLSNNFRLSYTRGIIFTFVSGLIFYLPYLFVLDKNLEICLNNCNTMEGFIYVLKNYSYLFFEFLNPTHKFELIESKIIYPENSPIYKLCGSIFDFSGRIFVSFGIYQTIQAFRKFGK